MMRVGYRQGRGVWGCSSGVVCENHLLGLEFSEGMWTHAHTHTFFNIPLGKPLEAKLKKFNDNTTIRLRAVLQRTTTAYYSSWTGVPGYKFQQQVWTRCVARGTGERKLNTKYQLMHIGYGSALLVHPRKGATLRYRTISMKRLSTQRSILILRPESCS